MGNAEMISQRAEHLATYQCAPLDLGRLIDPVDTEIFKRDYWERQHLVVSRASRDHYAGLLSLADVDHILAVSAIQPSQIRILRDGIEISLERLATAPSLGNAGVLESLYEEYRRGSTVVLQFLHERWEPLRRLCWSLAGEFSALLQANAYLTPAKARGLTTHYDVHDVFVLQTEGSKRWRLYEGPIQLPLKSQPYDANGMKPGRLLEEIELNVGDMLYIPRGCMHDATSGDSTSLHITVGINTLTWASLIVRAVESLTERESRYRESLPIGFARSKHLQSGLERHFTDLLNTVTHEIEPSVFISNAVQAALLGEQPVLLGHLLDLEDAQGISDRTPVRRRPEIDWRLTLTSEVASLAFCCKVVEFPAYVETQLRFIVRANQFTPGDLPGKLDDAGKLVMVQTLLREGFLTMCRAPRFAQDSTGTGNQAAGSGQ